MTVNIKRDLRVNDDRPRAPAEGDRGAERVLRSYKQAAAAAAAAVDKRVKTSTRASFARAQTKSRGKLTRRDTVGRRTSFLEKVVSGQRFSRRTIIIIKVCAYSWQFYRGVEQISAIRAAYTIHT